MGPWGLSPKKGHNRPYKIKVCFQNHANQNRIPPTDGRGLVFGVWLLHLPMDIGLQIITEIYIS